MQKKNSPAGPNPRQSASPTILSISWGSELLHFDKTGPKYLCYAQLRHARYHQSLARKCVLASLCRCCLRSSGSSLARPRQILLQLMLRHCSHSWHNNKGAASIHILREPQDLRAVVQVNNLQANKERSTCASHSFDNYFLFKQQHRQHRQDAVYI